MMLHRSTYCCLYDTTIATPSITLLLVENENILNSKRIIPNFLIKKKCCFSRSEDGNSHKV